MIWMALLFLICIAGMAAAFHRADAMRNVTEGRLWAHIAYLQADNRALTESLCRAEGKPFIPAHKEPLKPAEGWWDAQPKAEIYVKTKEPQS